MKNKSLDPNDTGMSKTLHTSSQRQMNIHLVLATVILVFRLCAVKPELTKDYVPTQDAVRIPSPVTARDFLK